MQHISADLLHQLLIVVKVTGSHAQASMSMKAHVMLHACMHLRRERRLCMQPEGHSNPVVKRKGCTASWEVN